MKHIGPHPTRAFTLVELLVVMSIVAVLISVLLPAIANAREASKRMYCGANLRTWGRACYTFANDYKSLIPPAWAYTNFFPAGSAAVPAFLPMDTNRIFPAGTTDEQKWKLWGATLPMLRAYGLDDGNLPPTNSPTAVVYTGRRNAISCPSTDAGIQVKRIDDYFGNTVATNYMYVGGYSLKKFPAWSFPAWSESGGDPKHPVTSLTDANLDSRVLAADRFFYATSGALWQNHGYTSASGGIRPNYQNILFGDGHVKGATASYYPQPLTLSNYSFRDVYNEYFYWGP